MPGFQRLRESRSTGADPGDDGEFLREQVAEGALPGNGNLAREQRRAATAVEPAPEPAQTREIDEEAMDEIVRASSRFYADLADRLGVSVRIHRATYSPINARLEVEVSTVRDDGVVMDRHAEEFLNRCGDFGLAPTDLGREIVCAGDTLRIVGLRPRAKQQILCESVDRRSRKRTLVRMSAESVRSHLAH